MARDWLLRETSPVWFLLCWTAASPIFFVVQPKRLGALAKFTSKSHNILVAMDVASRGLDIPHVDIVINFDIPQHSKVGCGRKG